MSDLVFHVRRYVPEADGDELEQRVTLLKARDFAAVIRSRAQTKTAFDLACEAHEVAGQFVFADLETASRLEQAASLCRHLVTAAALAERLHEGAGT